LITADDLNDDLMKEATSAYNVMWYSCPLSLVTKYTVYSPWKPVTLFTKSSLDLHIDLSIHSESRLFSGDTSIYFVNNVDIRIPLPKQG
jgi:hypothetical protein